MANQHDEVGLYAYATLGKHIEIPVVGVMLSAAAVAAIVFTPYAGSLVARYGAKRVLTICLGLNAIAFVLLATLQGAMQIAPVLIFHIVVERVARSARQVLATRIGDGDKRNQLLAVHRALRNTGFAVGAVVASVLLLIDSVTALILAFALNAASCILAAFFFTLTAPKLEDRDESRDNKIYITILKDKDYLLASILNGVVGLHSSLLTIGIPIMIIGNQSIPSYAAGLALAINTVIVALFQVSFSDGVEGIKGAFVCYRRAILPYAASFVILFASSVLDMPAAEILLLAAVLALTIGELLTSVSEFLVSVELADSNNKARYLTVFGLGHDMQDIVGPVLIAFVMAAVGDLSWLLFGMVIVAATCVLMNITYRRSEFSSDL